MPHESPTSLKPYKKRQKKSLETGSGLVMPRGRGKLRAITEMPMDVVLEAPDLLNISRLSKSLREILMSKSARPIWVRVLSRDPDFPWAEFPRLGMNEPQFVNLAFSDHCHVRRIVFVEKKRTYSNVSQALSQSGQYPRNVALQSTVMSRLSSA
ncbi:hypothetical protein V5O48_014034 [Marasmius crinis-equi]|uniref:F-box domain-containing protein n=1 Tax=Marasmius crinis-equi TaxID=585013 RepID=A0ABR3EYU0_9AGAR